MLYLRLTDGRHLLILEPGNLRELERGGNPAVSPDKEVMVAYTPDLEWLTGQVEKRWSEVQSNPEILVKLLEESQKRPAVDTRKDQPVRVLTELEN
jgi:hypothetical protein